MARNELKKRDKWQTVAGRGGRSAEDSYQVILSQHFDTNDLPYEIIRQPNIFNDVYNKGEKDKNGKIKGRHGLKIDFQIRNKSNNKSVFVEIKRQDAGRGNAHERACKFLTPGLIETGRKKGNIKPPHIPFFMVFSNGIARDKKRVEEISYWFGEYRGNFLFWEDLREYKQVVKHFKDNIEKVLK